MELDIDLLGTIMEQLIIDRSAEIHTLSSGSVILWVHHLTLSMGPAQFIVATHRLYFPTSALI